MFFNPFILAEKVLVGTEKLDGTQITAMTIIGLLVVFSALLILVIYLTISGSVFRSAGQKQKKPAAKKQPETKPAPVKSAPPKAQPAAKPAAKPAAPAAASEDDDEVIAVIMAAISAMSAADGKQYQVRSVRQVTRNSARGAWAQAGRISATQPF